MRLFPIVCLAACTLLACNSSQVDETTKTTNDSASTVTQPTAAAAVDTLANKAGLHIEPFSYFGRVAVARFDANNKTLFYYNVDDKEGHIIINGKQYNFDYFKHEVNEPTFSFKSGKDLSIEVTGTTYTDDDPNPEPGIMSGKAAKVVIQLGDQSVEMKNVSVIDGTNAD